MTKCGIDALAFLFFFIPGASLPSEMAVNAAKTITFSLDLSTNNLTDFILKIQWT